MIDARHLVIILRPHPDRPGRLAACVVRSDASGQRLLLHSDWQAHSGEALSRLLALTIDLMDQAFSHVKMPVSAQGHARYQQYCARDIDDCVWETEGLLGAERRG